MKQTPETVVLVNFGCEEIQKFADIAMKAKNIRNGAFEVTRDDVVDMYRTACEKD